MGRWVGQKRAQKVGYPLWMAPKFLPKKFEIAAIFLHMLGQKKSGKFKLCWGGTDLNPGFTMQAFVHFQP